MLESIQPDLPKIPVPPAGRVDFAKWPPDDDEPGAPPPAGGGVPSGGGYSGGDGDFKKGRFNPVVILIGVIAVAGLAAFLMMGAKQDAEKLAVDKAEELKKGIFVLPAAEQLPRWREWGKTDKSDHLKQEALKQLAWARDPEGVELCIQALKDPSEPVQSQAAAALAEYGRPLGEKARPALLEFLKTAGSGARPQAAWALVVLGETAALDEVMKLYRLGHLSQVQRLGGGVAFDPEKIVGLMSLDKLAGMAGDESPAVRQLVATVLSRNAEPKWTQVLVKLLGDSEPEVARMAAPGLGKIGDAAAREPLVAALKKADADSREKFLHALRDGIGASGLVLALDSVTEETDVKKWHQTGVVFDMIRKLADPRGGDALAKYIESKPYHIHWETEAAFALAEIGDVRGVPSLATRMRMDEAKIYSERNPYEWKIKLAANERIIAARMIADLGMMHPDKRQFIREKAMDPIWSWLEGLPSPHANGLRALAAMDARDKLGKLRAWADPKAKFPVEGQQPPMPEEWVVAQSALRYVGMMKDEQSWTVLERQLGRRPKDLDMTMESLMGGGLAILGMTTRALAYGASDGLSEWGDPKGFKPLFEFIQEPKENEQGRERACMALAWVATEKDMQEVIKKFEEYKKPDKADQFRRECLIETLIQRPMQGTQAMLVDLIKPESSLDVRHQAARALGKSGFDKTVEGKLFELLKNDALMNDGALALIMGGDGGTAARAVAMYADKPKEVIEELQDLWFRSFGYWSHEDLDQGHIFRWVDNAVAISRIQIRQTPQEWARVLLMKQFDNLQFDNGPHSFTRVVLRFKLGQMARSDDARKRAGAINTLKFMGEQGMLLALRGEAGETGRLARDAYFELMNPKVVTDVKVPVDDTRPADPTK